MRDIADLPSAGDADIAALASLFADPARCAVLLALDDGRALPASVLADEAGVSRSTASSHLTKLTEAGLLNVETHGRHRSTDWPGDRSARSWSNWWPWPRHGRSVRFARAHGPRGCARPVPATTTWQGVSAWN
jgi:DNA-binding transcriptional ArsR family regulator